LAPTFIEYERAAMSFGCEVKVLDTVTQDFVVEKQMLTLFAQSVDALFICNPNNPTAILYEKTFLLDVIAACPDTTFIIDEAFMEFVVDQEKVTLLYDIHKLKNVAVIRSLTKAFSIPGLRLGFMITSSETLKKDLAWALNPWNVNGFVSAYMTEVLERAVNEPFSGDVFKPLRDDMIKALSQMPQVEVLPSEVNYIFFRYSGSQNLQLRLDAHHILIRDCSNYRGLKVGDYRIAVRTAAENKCIIDHLKNITEE